jgi:hypothetical protein
MMDMIVIIAFSLVLLILIAYLYFKDQGLLQKLSAYEGVIDELGNRIYTLENKKIEVPKIDIDIESELAVIEKKLNDKINDLSDPILKTIRAIKELESNMLQIEESVNERINKIEESTKLSALSVNSAQVNENRIIDLYKKGFSAEEIAKKERVPQGEVDLILRIANLR